MDETPDEIRERHLGNGVALGMSLGVAMGASLGLVLESSSLDTGIGLSVGIGIGLSIGTGLGIALGVVQGNKHVEAALESSRTPGHDGAANHGADGLTHLRVPFMRPRVTNEKGPPLAKRPPSSSA